MVPISHERLLFCLGTSIFPIVVEEYQVLDKHLPAEGPQVEEMGVEDSQVVVTGSVETDFVGLYTDIILWIYSLWLLILKYPWWYIYKELQSQ